MKTTVVIQARMGSTRLPGKVMMPLAGRTVLSQVIARVQAAPVDEIVVATTVHPTDLPIVLEAERCGASWFRGSEEDVLSRYYLAAQQSGADLVVRVTSDCPLFDPSVLSTLLQRFKGSERLDYLSNTLERTYPRGLDAEVFTAAALERAYREATKPHEREHVTPYLYQHPELFRIEQLKQAVDLSHHRWTLDTPEDFQLIDAIYAAMGGMPFSTEDVLSLLERRPDLVALNAHIEQKKLAEGA